MAKNPLLYNHKRSSWIQFEIFPNGHFASVTLWKVSWWIQFESLRIHFEKYRIRFAVLEIKLKSKKKSVLKWINQLEAHWKMRKILIDWQVQQLNAQTPHVHRRRQRRPIWLSNKSNTINYATFIGVFQN